jgi:hypothetical protein
VEEKKNFDILREFQDDHKLFKVGKSDFPTIAQVVNKSFRMASVMAPTGCSSHTHSHSNFN